MWGATISESGVSLSAANAAQRATKWESAPTRGAMIPRHVARLCVFCGRSVLRTPSSGGVAQARAAAWRRRRPALPVIAVFFASLRTASAGAGRGVRGGVPLHTGGCRGGDDYPQKGRGIGWRGYGHPWRWYVLEVWESGNQTGCGCAGVMVVGAVTSAKMSASCWRASCWLSQMAKSGDVGVGWRSACVRACAAAVAALRKDGTGRRTCLGNQTTVSMTRSADVSLT